MENILGRILPDYIEGYGKVNEFKGAFANMREVKRIGSKVNPILIEKSKILGSIEVALDEVEIRSGMCISFHHHLRNGDYILNMVMEAIAKRGVKDLTIAASSIFPVHSPLVEYIEEGIVTKIYSNYISGPVAEAISNGKLKYPVIMHTHGGRARAIESGDLHIDIAFIAAPCSDDYGNINGLYGKSACGALGYAIADAQYADKVIAITDNLVSYPNSPIEINQSYVDYIVKVDSIGNPSGIVSGTTQITKDPIGLRIAKTALDVMVASGLVKDGMSFQTGAGGISLAVAAELREYMKSHKIKGAFASGGITGYIVDMFEEGLFESLLDVQCFDLKAVESCRVNNRHMAMSASMYGNPHNSGSVVNKLNIVILGATEIDTNFNVNVTTSSDGTIMGGSGGHADTAAGADLTIIVTKLTKARLPIIKDRLTTVTTPGETIDVIVTERGIAVNPRRIELINKLKECGLKVLTIQELKTLAESITGVPKPIEVSDDIVGVVEYRDGTVIDVIRKTL